MTIVVYVFAGFAFGIAFPHLQCAIMQAIRGSYTCSECKSEGWLSHD